mgnify:CR=1 FL=1
MRAFKTTSLNIIKKTCFFFTEDPRLLASPFILPSVFFKNLLGDFPPLVAGSRKFFLQPKKKSFAPPQEVFSRAQIFSRGVDPSPNCATKKTMKGLINLGTSVTIVFFCREKLFLKGRVYISDFKKLENVKDSKDFSAACTNVELEHGIISQGLKIIFLVSQRICASMFFP